MMDYIQWLLEVRDEEPTEVLTWKTWSLAGVKRKAWEKAISEKVRSNPSLPIDDGGVQDPTELKQGTGAAEILEETARLSRLSAQRREKISLERQREQVPSSVEYMEGKTGKAGENLYRQAVRLERLAGFAREQTCGDRGEIREKALTTWKLPDLRNLDHAFQQDARRYDGGFSLL